MINIQPEWLDSVEVSGISSSEQAAARVFALSTCRAGASGVSAPTDWNYYNGSHVF